MITIDKLVLAFKLQDHGTQINQFDRLQTKIEEIETTSDFDIGDFDFSDYCAIHGAYYQFNETKLEEISLKDIHTHFRFNYYVYVGGSKKIALLQWGSNGTTSQYGYMTLLNHTFYNRDWILYKRAVEDLQLQIHNVSRLDIAYDSFTDPTKRYFRIVRDKENEIVINGNIINDRCKLLHSPYFICRGTLNDPMSNPQIHFSTSDKSTTCRVYNKTKEIEESSHKSYISELYNKIIHKESDIYRCEISLNSKILYRSVEAIATKENLSSEEGLLRFLTLLEDDRYLTIIHRETMMRLFRYSHKGKGKRKTLLSYKQ